MKLALYGYGGHAREVACQIGEPVIFYVDDEYVNEFTKPISEFDPKSQLMMVAISNCQDREKIINNLPSSTQYFTFIHPTAQIMDDNIEVGCGSFIGANSILTTNIKIGKHAILNRGNHIGHDCVIGDYFSAMPNATVSGDVWVGNKVYMGSCSNIKEKIKIAANTTIGMNAAVIKNITEEGVTMVGVPAKKII